MEAKRGRPIKMEGAKRSAIAVRTTEETKERITAAAEAAGRSLTQEIEQRLEWSLSFEDEFGGAKGVALHRHIAWSLRQAEKQIGSKWTESPTAFFAAMGAIEAALEELQPPYSGETGQMINRLYREKQDAQRLYQASYNALRDRFPVPTQPNALLPYELSYKFIPQTVPDYAYSRLMEDDELDDAVRFLEPADEALVRDHQKALHALQMAETGWKLEMEHLVNQAAAAREGARRAMQLARRHVTEARSIVR
jgi:hypothetical protein